jgi:hypothetical protein
MGLDLSVIRFLSVRQVVIDSGFFRVDTPRLFPERLIPLGISVLRDTGV